jgi:dynein light chain 1
VYPFQTTCAQALKNWETVNGVSAEEADYVKLYCQVPPINKLDSSLNSLRNCERLALSTNTIDRMISLAGMSRLKILSLGRNQIKKVNIFGSFPLILFDSVSWGDRSRS